MKLSCDNLGVQQKCKSIHFNNLRSHLYPYSDLYLTYKDIAFRSKIHHSWIHGHSEKKPWQSVSDLVKQWLSNEEIYNVWCNKQAEFKWQSKSAGIADPGVTTHEKWAFFSNHPQQHKIISDLGKDIHTCLSYSNTQTYIQNRNGITESKLNHVNAIFTHIFSACQYTNKPQQWRCSITGSLHMPIFADKAGQRHLSVLDVKWQLKRHCTLHLVLIFLWSNSAKNCSYNFLVN